MNHATFRLWAWRALQAAPPRYDNPYLRVFLKVFKVELINNQEFGITYVGKKHFIIKVAGKKYNPTNLGELDRASDSITELLQLNYAVDKP